MEAKEKVILRDVLYGMKSQFCITVFQRNYSEKMILLWYKEYYNYALKM